MNGTRWQAANEVHVAAQPIQFAHNDRPTELTRYLDGGGELRATIERVRAFPRFVLFKRFGDLEAFCLGKSSDGVALSMQTEAALGLSLRAHPDIGHGPSCRFCALRTMALLGSTSRVCSIPEGWTTGLLAPRAHVGGHP
jgi:hypothetical protein